MDDARTLFLYELSTCAGTEALARALPSRRCLPNGARTVVSVDDGVGA